MSKVTVYWNGSESCNVDPSHKENFINAEFTFAHEFDTDKEARAFILGLEEMSGWMGDPAWRIDTE